MHSSDITTSKKSIPCRFFSPHGVLLLTFALLLSIEAERTFGVAVDQFLDKFIDAINNEQSLWKAGRNFGPYSAMYYVRKGMGAIWKNDKLKMLPVLRHNLEGLEIPDKFDWREHFPNCASLTEIRDQRPCGSCWAVSSAAAMTDRICIHSEGKIKVRLSEENLISCCDFCGAGCMGGSSYAAFNYWNYVGIVSGGPYGSAEGCQPYELPPCEHHINGSRPSCDSLKFNTPKCKTTCQNGYSTSYKDDLHFAKNAYYIENDVKQIQAEIMKNGPVVGVFDVYRDLFHYKSGVYKHVKGKLVGGHDVKILGWGVENGIPYWLIANSWNTDWGDSGYFKIIRGEDECGIESEISAGIPA